MTCGIVIKLRFVVICPAGHCLLLQDRYDSPEDIFELLAKGPEPLQSHFATGYGMVLKILNLHSLENARKFVQRSFYNYLGKDIPLYRLENEIAT